MSRQNGMAQQVRHTQHAFAVYVASKCDTAYHEQLGDPLQGQRGDVLRSNQASGMQALDVDEQAVASQIPKAVRYWSQPGIAS